MPVEYRDRDTLIDNGKNMGDLIKLEGIVLDDLNGQYARVFFRVHIDYSIPREIEIHIEWGVWKQKVEIEECMDRCPNYSQVKYKDCQGMSKEAIEDPGAKDQPIIPSNRVSRQYYQEPSSKVITKAEGQD